MQHHGLVQHNALMSSTHKLQRQQSILKKPTPPAALQQNWLFQMTPERRQKIDTKTGRAERRPPVAAVRASGSTQVLGKRPVDGSIPPAAAQVKVTIAACRSPTASPMRLSGFFCPRASGLSHRVPRSSTNTPCQCNLVSMPSRSVDVRAWYEDAMHEAAQTGCLDGARH